ncbi:hypothetical protein ULMS_05310 [Patiriisocius marinistellae]|uniref:Uncharacterized protein n=1 Tax=Patiriisocius marinistellae TaxID=2494560 RepID=A0A5J4FTR3_9FLAO|nr:hypothetical protein [Patiriisocius marinistellae]GEQ85023.1 hypothetical protein ULMS_05310 [Patiriisocius marinistellae]
MKFNKLKTYNFFFSLIIFLVSITISSGQQNIDISPARLGPNALPIPELRMGGVNNHILLRTAYESQTSEGDKTHNAYLQLDVPIIKDRVGFRMFVVPYERFKLSQEVKEERNIKEDGLKGTAGGDIYIETQIQILKDKVYLPDVLLNIGIKTASGTNLEFARYTDSPGYLFDLSLGKTILKKNKSLIKLYAQTGLFVFQTNRTTVYRQNDAFSYGVGMQYQVNKWIFNNELAGYRGYINNGDRYNAFRTTIRTNFNGLINFEGRFQQGIAYNDYTSFRIGLIFNLDDIKNWFIKNAGE